MTIEILLFSDVNGSYGFGRYAGPYRLATELRLHGFSVQVIDFFADWSFDNLEQIFDRYVGPNTLWVGFSTTLLSKFESSEERRRLFIEHRKSRNYHSFWKCQYLPQSDDTIQEIFSMIRQHNPKTKVVIGGGKVHKAKDGEDIPGVDYWVWGEADKVVVSLSQHLKDSNILQSFSTKVGSRLYGTRMPYKFEDFHTSQIIWTPEDHIFPNEHLPIEIARGCAFRCSFCNFTKKRHGEYIKQPAVLREEFIRNYNQFGTTGYMFCDDTYNDSMDKIRDMSGMLTALPFDLEYSCYARVDMIHRFPDMAKYMLDSGIRSVLFGIETFHHEAAKKIGKGLDPAKIKDTLYWLKELWGDQVIMSGSFIVGLPGEPVDSIMSTANWLAQDDCPLDAYDFTPLFIEDFDPLLNEQGSVTFSKMSQDPSKYNLNRGSLQPWVSDNLSYLQAVKLADRLISSDTYRANNKIMSLFAFYSRMKNLGYSHKECKALTLNGASYDDMESRKQVIRNNYFEKLLS